MRPCGTPDSRESLSPLLRRRRLEGDVRGSEGLLGAGDARLHRRDRLERHSSDLIGGEPCDHAKGQRDLGGSAQHRVARCEDQAQEIIVDRLDVGSLGGLVDGELGGEEPFPVVQTRTPAPPVDRAALGDEREPDAGVPGNPGVGPLFKSFDEGFLRQILRRAEVAGHFGEGGHDARALDAPDGVDGTADIIAHQDVPRTRQLDSALLLLLLLLLAAPFLLLLDVLVVGVVREVGLIG